MVITICNFRALLQLSHTGSPMCQTLNSHVGSHRLSPKDIIFWSTIPAENKVLSSNYSRH